MRQSSDSSNIMPRQFLTTLLLNGELIWSYLNKISCGCCLCRHVATLSLVLTASRPSLRKNCTRWVMFVVDSWKIYQKMESAAYKILASPKTTSCHNSPLIECGIFIFRLIDNWILWNLSSRQTATKLNNTLYHHKAGRIQNRFFFPLSARIGCFQTSGDVIERRELHHEWHDENVALHWHRSESWQCTRIVV